ncbi:MAG: TraR/DksA family transcriptional regulator [Motiliproteus sp.]
MSNMNAAQLRQVKQLLLQNKQDLDAAIKSAELSSQPVDLDQSKVGRVSRIDAIQQQQLAKANVQTLKTQQLLMDKALLRLEAGEYGECLGCGEGILLKRLLIRPESPYCVDCQAASENC